MPKSNVLSNNPYRGTQDFFPQEMQIRRYIFDTWRSVCERFGYEEYQTPLLEDANLYRAKSGDEVGGKELFTLTDLKGRELAIRPEMTPSVTRMVSRRYNELPKPIRLFNISNFMRQERPQRGRNREFWQLNFDIFGEDSSTADLEILVMAIEIMQELGAPKDSFWVSLNNRKLINDILDKAFSIPKKNWSDTVKIIDKYNKLEPEAFAESLFDLGFKTDQLQKLTYLLSTPLLSDNEIFPEIEESESYQEIQSLVRKINDLGYDNVSFYPGLMRGFDYYDGMIFEVFDTNPENNRSLFGGGRYNGLASLFGATNFAAVGCAPGDETLALFIKSWGIDINTLSPNIVYIPQLIEDVTDTFKLSGQLRRQGICVVAGLLTETISQALSSANKRGYSWVVIVGEDEVKNGKYTLKNMRTSEQFECSSLAEVINLIQSENTA